MDFIPTTLNKSNKTIIYACVRSTRSIKKLDIVVGQKKEKKPRHLMKTVCGFFEKSCHATNSNAQRYSAVSRYKHTLLFFYSSQNGGGGGKCRKNCLL